MPIELNKIQQALQAAQIDGWLLYDFRGSNPLARSLLGIRQDAHLTRRFFYWIPREGNPIKLVHKIESGALDALPGEKRFYLEWELLHEQLAEILPTPCLVAMEYSPHCALPYISRVDGGTIELVRSFGAEVISSAPLLQQFTAVWDADKWQSHLRAAECANRAVEEAWAKIAAGASLTEYEMQQWILKRFDEMGFYSEWDPIVAVNAHSADPHFSPSKENSSPINKGDFILIDLGCKEKRPHSVYSDYTRVAVVAEKPTAEQAEVFDIVKRARDAAIHLIKERVQAGKEVLGCEVDRVCREVIQKSGYGKEFIHRTGHSIDEEAHGPGANLDSLETLDDRPLIPATCFSVEPGIYLPGKFGVRLEVDVYISPQKEVIVTGKLQESIKKLF